jgi:hypothetical protein
VHFDLFFETSLAPQAIDGFVFGGLNDPGARRIGHAFSAPLIDSGGKRLLRGVFSQLEVAKLPDKSGHNAAPIRAVNLIDGRIGVGKHV